MAKYFSVEYLKGEFRLFSLSHLSALATIIIINIVIVLWMRRTENERVKSCFCYILSAILLLQEVSLNIWNAATDQWSVGSSLPLHLCGVAIIISPIMLIKKNYFIYEIIYFWGFGGAIQALLTPDITYQIPHYRFFQFFISHGCIITATIYMTFVHGFRPRPFSLVKIFIITNIYLGIMALFNLLVNGNYLFICHPPETPSLIDYLGPWPWYILSLEGVGIASFLIYYSPFFIKDMVVKILARNR